MGPSSHFLMAMVDSDVGAAPASRASPTKIHGLGSIERLDCRGAHDTVGQYNPRLSLALRGVPLHVLQTTGVRLAEAIRIGWVVPDRLAHAFEHDASNLTERGDQQNG